MTQAASPARSANDLAAVLVGASVLRVPLSWLASPQRAVSAAPAALRRAPATAPLTAKYTEYRQIGAAEPPPSWLTRRQPLSLARRLACRRTDEGSQPPHTLGQLLFVHGAEAQQQA